MDLTEDEIGSGGPDERFGVLVAVVDVGKHGFLQGVNGGMAPATHASFGDFGEQPFYEIEPASAGWGEVDVMRGCRANQVCTLATLCVP